MKYLLLLSMLSFSSLAIDYKPQPLPEIKLPLDKKYKSQELQMKWRLNRFEMKTDEWKFKFKFSKKKVKAQIKIRF